MNSLRRFVLNRLNRDRLFTILFHVTIQWLTFAILGKFDYTRLQDCGWIKRSDRLFIIAAGPSVNEISTENWREIERDDTLALSYGSLIPARIDAFFSEFAPPAISPNQKALFLELSRRRELNGTGPICIWKHPEKVTNTEFLNLPVVKILTLVLPAVSAEALDRAVRFLTLLNVHRRCCLQAAGSISALIMFARAFDYKEVVLIGVDLSDRRYFFDENSAYAYIGLKNPFCLDGDENLSQAHQVTQRYNDISNVAARLKISAGENMKLSVTSKTSGLSLFMPVYRFNTDKGQ